MRSLLSLTIIALCIFLSSCREQPKLFTLVPSSGSGIHFNNLIVENDSINPIDITNLYNGGGVGIADFNNDGLQDVYFTGSMVENKLYLNEGDLRFRDITTEARVTGEGRWCRGVAIVDINNDGRNDIYVCVSMSANAEDRQNLLYVNEGVNKDSIPVFNERAAEYGLADTTHSTMASFFDYDNDGDLDVYIAVNEIVPSVNPSVFRPKITDGSFPSTGRLYRNDMNAEKQHGVFHDVTKEAGVTTEGYGHGVNTCDINGDGWKDILVTNDFIANDLLYINNHDGTFTDKAESYFKHTSANGMGQDVIDINNDGLPDVIELDMNPEDNYRKKMMLNPGSYQTFQLNNFFKYQYQYVRNTLQVNQGTRLNVDGTPGDPVFSDVAYFAGIAETDWSWAPLVADLDNDGLRDLVVTNGFPKDITDHDFIAYRKETSPAASQQNILSQIPEVKLHNYAFSNKGDCKFENVSSAWGFEKVSFSSGGAYADLDNDGDLDLIINNINDEAFLYENNSAGHNDGRKHYLRVKLTGDAQNINGLGASVELHYAGRLQVYEQNPYRGYLSSVSLYPHFGLDSVAVVDSLVIKWPNGRKQSVVNVQADQTIEVNIKNAVQPFNWQQPAANNEPVFKDVTTLYGLDYIHEQEDLIDFNIQKLLPHKFSEYGPSLAAGDVNGDGLDDLVAGGNASFPTTMFLQQADGRFTKRLLNGVPDSDSDPFQVMGIALFDADGDNDPDLYLARGGYHANAGNPVYNDRLFINDGTGSFAYDSMALPTNYASKSCVRATDFDKDGDLDLFIGGRVEPWHYPRPVSSFVYRNDSKPGHVKFTDVTEQVAPDLKAIGLVCDAMFTDFDNDGWPDLVITGEWMAPTFMKNNRGTFKNITETTGLATNVGWWNTVTGGDFDNDGDIDYVFGNLGENTFFKASATHPVSVYAKDFDNNGSYDPFLSIYLPQSQDTLQAKEYPAVLRDEVISQMTVMKSRFQNYRSYANASIKELFTGEELKNAVINKASEFRSSFCRNDGNGRFSLAALPYQAQLSAINGMVAEDVDGDSFLDLIINTNDYGTDVSLGRYDALNGLVLKGDGRGGFATMTIPGSGIFIPGNGKSLARLRNAGGQYLLAASQNRGQLKLYALAKSGRQIPVLAGDVTAELLLKNGTKQKMEFYSGSSFLSQSSRFIQLPVTAISLTIRDGKGNARKLSF